MNDKVDVSIIIVSYNTQELLRGCLTSLFEKTIDIDFEVIIVDNYSSDQSVKMVKQIFPRVKVFALRENIGFGRANNEGIRIAKGRNIFLLNPDTILLNNAVKILSDFLDSEPGAGVCGGNLYTKEEKPTHSFQMHLPTLYSEIDLLLGERLSRFRYGDNMFFNNSGHPLNVGYITGADMMIKKSVLTEVDYFDSDFFMYFEETELTYRIRDAGYDIVSVPEARIVHLEGQSCKLKERRECMFLKSRRLYLHKIYKCKLLYFACQVIYGINAFFHVVYHSLFCQDVDRLEIWKYRLKYFYREDKKIIYK